MRANSNNISAPDYDYIITGAGCAGLSLLIHLLQSKKFGDKKILLVDKDAKNSNDRTWCFWEKEPGLFQNVVYRQWPALWFKGHGLLKKLPLAPYQYKLIRGIDFYAFCFEEIQKHPNITFLQAEVSNLFSNEKEGTGITLSNGTVYKATYIFNSLLFQKPILKQHHFWLLQHFKGWVIKTGNDVFDASVGTLMDFSTSQENGTAFYYVLPFAPNRALVEYTLFSKELLPDSAYETSLKTYIKANLHIDDYTIEEKEFGVIPMSNHPFKHKEGNILHIGTAGGQTKASSGYTFRFIQKNAAAITESLIATGHPFKVKKSALRFAFYDSILLNILHHNRLPGAEVFTDLFKKNKPVQVLKFLDNETSVAEELSIISTLPTWPFFKAALHQLKKRLNF